jgi:drug/metabolite transporter (DMT)-like permease
MIVLCFFSIFFLKKRLTGIQWAGILTVVSGLVVVGVSDLLFSKVPEGNHTNKEKAVGIMLILLAMVFTSFQV